MTTTMKMMMMMTTTMTTMMISTYQYYFDMFVVQNHADPYIRNGRQESPLDLAAQYGRMETVSELAVLKAKESIDNFSLAFLINQRLNQIGQV